MAGTNKTSSTGLTVRDMFPACLSRYSSTPTLIDSPSVNRSNLGALTCTVLRQRCQVRV